MRYIIRFLLLIFAAMAPPWQSINAQQPSPTPETPSKLKQMTLEELADLEVTSPGKKEQEVVKSAAAIYVITQEDIRRSGVRSIPEALRLATGLEVTIFNNGTWSISARGFNITSANKMQVFLDGRSLYSPLFGGVFWDVQNTVIEDIDRIEVIRGPGASLWGGNAVNGVINIITKSATETQGGLFVAGGGAQEKGFTTMRYGGKIGHRVFYRLYSNYFDRDSLALQTGADAKDPFQMGQSGFRADIELSEEDQLTVQGDLYRGVNGLLNRSDISLHGGNLLARWTHRFQNGSDLQLQTYYDRTSRFVPQQFDEIRNTYDVDLQHHFHVAGRHDIVWGLGERVSNDNTKPEPLLFFDPSGRHLALFNIFGQDEISLRPDRLRLIIGSKFENNTYTGWDAQPTIRLAWTPGVRQTLWGAVSRAVRIPTQFDEDLRITAGTPNILIRGDRNFRSEDVIAYEIGFRTVPSERFGLSIATYYNDYDHLRSQESTPGTVFPIVLANNLRGNTYGVEITAPVQVLPWWRVTTTYSNLQKHLRLAPGSTDRTEGAQEGIDPRNQFSFRSFMNLRYRTELDFWVRYASALQLPSSPPVPSYIVFDARVGWRPRDYLEFSVAARNLPDRRHLEFGPLGELVRRSLYATVTCHF